MDASDPVRPSKNSCGTGAVHIWVPDRAELVIGRRFAPTRWLGRDDGVYASNMITLRTVLPAFIAAKPSLISLSFSLAEIQSSRCSRPRM